ncbi:hypothetical protein [Streptomyces sp. NPDC002994]|uniref:hypothetical protein n=1 Tax=Streptomyces sp. NPDC002994 TaxID=3154441 RepID=UPI0033B34D58
MTTKVLSVRQGYTADRSARGLPRPTARPARRRCLERQASGLSAELAGGHRGFGRPDDLTRRAAGSATPAVVGDRSTRHAHAASEDPFRRRPTGSDLVENLERTWISRNR